MKILLILFALFPILFGTSAHASRTDDTNDVVTISIDSAAVRQDERLSKPVSIAARNMPLKAVLDRFAAQTGVAISIDERDPASGYTILTQCDRVPVAKMMNALYGVFSTHRGEWAWVRTGKPAGYHYSFIETTWAKNRMETYTRILKGILTNYVAVLRDLAPMKMEERKLHRDALKKALFVENDAWLNSFFDNEDAEWVWSQASFFFGALSIQEQESVLKGSPIAITLNSLAPAVYDRFHESYLFSQPSVTDPSGKVTPIPEPDVVKFFLSNPNLKADRLAPMVMLTQGGDAISWMGTGHLEIGIREAIKHAWILPGDSDTDAAVNNIVSDVKDTAETHKDKLSVENNIALFLKGSGAHMSEESLEIGLWPICAAG